QTEKMKFKILSIVSMIALVSCSSANKISGDDGWVDLFDGETTNGWHTYGKEDAGAAWEVVDGSLYLNVEGKSKEDRGDLVTDKEYENYHLKSEERRVGKECRPRCARQ